MGKLSNKQSGFSSFEALLIVIILALISFVGWYVYNKRSVTTSNASTANTSTMAKTVDPYLGWNTYTSADGRFGFKYPATYTLDNQPNIQIGQNVWADFIRLTSNGQEKNNNFGIDFDLYLAPRTSSSVDTYSNGTTTVLPNKITLWQSNHVQTYANGPITYDCPNLQIGTDNSFSMKLPNNKYLTIDGSFCWGQGMITGYSYSEILSSTEWKNAINVIKSVNYN